MDLCNSNHPEICYDDYDVEGNLVRCPLCDVQRDLGVKITEMEKTVMKVEKERDDLLTR